MSSQTITLESELVERLKSLAQGRDLNQVVAELLENIPSPTPHNWALAVVEAMKSADIQWIDDPEASTNSRDSYKQHLSKKWMRTQNSDDQNG